MTINPRSFLVDTFSSPYGDWKVVSAAPPEDFVGSVSQYWESSGAVAYGFERMPPRGTAELIFNLGGPQIMFDGETQSALRVYRKAWVSGLFNRPLYVGPADDAGHSESHLVGVSIQPWGIYDLFGVNASELVNTVIEADDLFGPDLLAAWNQIANASGPNERYQIVMGFLRSCRAKLARQTPFSVLWAAQETSRHFGCTNIQAMCLELEISRKHLAELYKRSIGFSPKAYAKIIRFRSIMSRIDRLSSNDFAGIAADAGYFDQSHFIHEFKAFAGDTPSNYLRDVSSDGESVLFDPAR
jgi:AraC-like DNA-binding protein